MKRIRIGLPQCLTLFTNLVFGKAVGLTAGAVHRQVGNDAWISMTLAFAAGLAVMAVMVWLARRHGSAGPVTYLPKLFGGFAGKLVAGLLAFFFLVAFVVSAITIDVHISDYLLTETPMTIMVILYTSLCALGVHLGLEVAARLSVLGFISTIVLNMLVAVGLVTHIHPERILPILDHGILPVAAASLIALPDVAIATTAALVVLPLTVDPSKWMRAGVSGLAAGGILVMLWVVGEVMVLGPEVTAQYLVSCMELARAAELSIYVHRYELIMVVLFVYGVLTQSIVCLYCTVELAASALPVRVSRRVLILICSAIGAILQYFLSFDRTAYAEFLETVWPAVGIPLGIGVPLLIAAVALLRSLFGEKAAASS